MSNARCNGFARIESQYSADYAKPKTSESGATGDIVPHLTRFYGKVGEAAQRLN